MLHLVKGLFEIQLQDNDFFSRLVTDVKELESPSKVVLNGSSLNETILVGVYYSGDYCLKPVGEELGQAFQRVVQ